MKKDGLSIFWVAGLSLMSLSLNAQLTYKDISAQSGVKVSGENIGVAFGDYDNDGDEDLYVSVRDGKNKLFQNIDGSHFINVAELAGVDFDGSSRTSIWLDINNDHFLDLYVGNFDENDVLYLNQGDGTFLDITREGRIYNPGRTFSVNAADVNQDGFVDIYTANFREENKLYLNRGDNSFTNIIDQSGAKSVFNAMGAIFLDYDKDNDMDLYLTHDGQPYILYKNIGGGNYVDVSEQAGVDYQGFGMGVDIGDVNNDGWLDIYITNLYENVLFLNNGNGTFSNQSEKAGIQDYGMGWGTNFLDFNNDGFRDIYVTNDSYFSPYPNVLYKNMGDSSFQSMVADTEVASMMAGYGSAVADINLDGFVDLAVANAGSKDFLQLFTNQYQKGNWIGFKLEGTKSNRAAIGARLELVDDHNVLHVDEVNAGSGYASMNSLVIHFGLGDASKIKSGKIIWPSGKRQELEDLAQGHYYKVTEGEEPVIFQQQVTSAAEIPSVIQAIRLSPNPVSDRVRLDITLTEDSPLIVGIIDQNGRLLSSLLRKNGVRGNNNWVIDTPPQIPAGTYQVVLIEKRRVMALPLVILR